MSNVQHNFSRSCELYSSRKRSKPGSQEHSDTPPPITTRFFYASRWNIDDHAQAGSNPEAMKVQLLPFTELDNARLESAWRRYARNVLGWDARKSKVRTRLRRHTQPGKAARGRSVAQGTPDSRGVQGLDIGQKEEEREDNGVDSKAWPDSDSGSSVRETFLAEGLGPDATDEESEAPSSAYGTPTPSRVSTIRRRPGEEPNRTVQRISSSLGETNMEGPLGDPDAAGQRSGSRTFSTSRARGRLDVSEPSSKQDTSRPPNSAPATRLETKTPKSRTPYLARTKAPKKQPSRKRDRSLLKRFADSDVPKASHDARPSSAKPQKIQDAVAEDHDIPSPPPATKLKSVSSEPVGISRLRTVQFPEFEMQPLYWDPTADKAFVYRATWFYKSTMRPVRQDLANQLELGYNSIKPWTETYKDEVKSCLRIGPEAESKVVYDVPSLQPDDMDNGADIDDKYNDLLELDWKPLAIGSVGAPGVKEETDKRVPSSRHVIYADSQNAQILGSNQLPSKSRRVLGQVCEGKTVGIPVVRGFKQEAWEKLNLSKSDRLRIRTKASVPHVRGDRKPIDKENQPCVACQTEKDRARVSDLVLVIHGIGQKYSTRSEGWRFMHAMNDLRSEVRKTQDLPHMQPLLRKDLGQIMILPVEWRTKFSPETAGENSDDIRQDLRNGTSTDYSLADVTCKGIPNVRDVFNDVMLDIPYYMSSHREGMEQAMIQEANRIYRLFCQHNPGFAAHGRVHLVAHSLGSVMALSALSHQPTRISDLSQPAQDSRQDGEAWESSKDQLTLSHPKKQLNPATHNSQTTHSTNKNRSTPGPPTSPEAASRPASARPTKSHFAFDTKNVFFCGSPAGFFLLLHGANLVPRRGHAKPGLSAAAADIGGAVGRYGCMAVDNVYNVIHRNDPIAYRVNACVDPHYTALLKDASLPGVGASWFALWGGGARRPPVLQRVGHGGGAEHLDDVRPKLSNMPSTVELEEHHFHREEMAERKMRHLNDNGQIDWYTAPPGPGGFTEYLNILSAHSSYWTCQEFIRFLVLEVGREPGPEGAIVQLKAEKRSAWVKRDPSRVGVAM